MERKRLDMALLKAFIGDKFSVAKLTISPFDRVENTGKKGENTVIEVCKFFWIMNKSRILPCGKGLIDIRLFFPDPSFV